MTFSKLTTVNSGTVVTKEKINSYKRALIGNPSNEFFLSTIERFKEIEIDVASICSDITSFNNKELKYGTSAIKITKVETPKFKSYCLVDTEISGSYKNNKKFKIVLNTTKYDYVSQALDFVDVQCVSDEIQELIIIAIKEGCRDSLEVTKFVFNKGIDFGFFNPHESIFQNILSLMRFKKTVSCNKRWSNSVPEYHNLKLR